MDGNSIRKMKQGADSDRARSSALLEQLVYVDNYMNGRTENDLSPDMDMDRQLSLELAAFVDNSFVFPDEETKPEDNRVDERSSSPINEQNNNHVQCDQPVESVLRKNEDVRTLKDESDKQENMPRWPVPPQAKSSLESVGLSSKQIELLSALVAQHQLNLVQQEAPSDSASGGSVSTFESAEGNYDDSAIEKRKRNTAASARFRIKKKVREKEMESRINSLGDTIKTFENKVLQLELENKLLKSLIFEKGSRKSEDELHTLRERYQI